MEPSLWYSKSSELVQGDTRAGLTGIWEISRWSDGYEWGLLKAEDIVPVANGGTANRMMGLMRLGDTVIDRLTLMGVKDTCVMAGIVLKAKVYVAQATYGWSLLWPWPGGYNGGRKN